MRLGKIALPDDTKAVGYKKISEFDFAQVFTSAEHNFTGTEDEFVEAGHGYEYMDAEYKRIILKEKRK